MSRSAARSALNLLLVLAFTAAFYVSVSTHTAPRLSHGTPFELSHTASLKPSNLPGWTKAYARAFPGCDELDGDLHDQVVVVHQDGDADRMAFDEAWAVGHDGAWANDVWTVGGC